MDKRTERGLIFVILWVIAGGILVALRVFSLTDISQALAYLFVGVGGSIFYYGWGSKLAPPQLRDLPQGITESEEERLRLFRRLYPETMTELDGLPGSLSDFERLPNGAEMAVKAWVISDGLQQAPLLTEDELNQMNALEGEVTHYALEQVRKWTRTPDAIPKALPNESADTPENERWLKANYPRVWEFVTSIDIITSEHDFYDLQDQLMKLFTVNVMRKDWIPGRAKVSDSFEMIEAQKIAIAMLFNKKRVPPKKHWWS